MGNTLLEIVRKQKNGESIGICSVCSSSPFVIDAAILQAKERGSDVLIEATANQVNQFGGYTGMLPEDFRDWVTERADKAGLDRGRVILGGDHLGPVAWEAEPAREAMDKAEALVRAYAKAGFTKIHLDCSMPLGEEKTLSTEEIAERTVRLCRACEEEVALAGNPLPAYVIGSEVPTPGGSGDDEEGLTVTKPSSLTKMIECFRERFEEEGLPWDRIIAAVVQPGVEFGNDSVHEYVPEEAAELIETARNIPGIVLEGHSTDYQTEESLRAMVRDGIAVLKVGPALTFAAREALFALSEIEDICLGTSNACAPSDFVEVLDRVMLEDPSSWRHHYTEEEPASTLLRKYSYSDRSRYYMSRPKVQEALDRLVSNLREIDLPMTLISQYLPDQYEKIREGRLNPEPKALVIDKVRGVLDQYWRACGSI